MSSKVLVTGANGQLAKTMRKLYYKNDQDIKFSFVTKEELDISDSHQIISHFNKHNYDYCINCAAYTHVEQAEKTPEIAFKINAEGVKNLAEACKETKIILIHMSTDYVFDGEKESGYTEQDSTNPINVYGKSKLLGEQYIQEILDDYFIVRTSWLYSEYGHNFLKSIYSKIKKGKKLKITTTEKGSPTSCKSLADFIYFLITCKIKYGLYHFTEKEEMTWFEFAKEIKQSSKFFNDRSVISPVENFESTVNRPKYSVLSNEKRNQYYNSIIPLSDRIKEVISSL